MIKNQTKNRNILLQTDIEYLVKPTANILLTSKILNTSPWFWEQCSQIYVLISIQNVKVINIAIKQEKEIKAIKIENLQVKLSYSQMTWLFM